MRELAQAAGDFGAAVFRGSILRSGRLGGSLKNLAISSADLSDIMSAVCEGPLPQPAKLRADLFYFRATVCGCPLENLATFSSDLLYFGAIVCRCPV